MQRMFERKNKSGQNFQVLLNQETCENQQLLCLFTQMQLLKNIAFLTIFTFFPLIHSLTHNLPDFHPRCSTKNKVFLVIK